MSFLYINYIRLRTKTHKRITDDQAIDQYLSTQSPYYFNLLYERYINKVYSKCISLLKDEAMAHDATQEIFMKIFLNLAKFNRKSKFSTWLYSITYNYCIDFLRKKKKETKLFSSEEKEGSDIIEEVDDREIMEMEISRLKIVLEKLPKDDKTVLLMKYKEELSIKEIGAIFGKSESAIKMKIKRAKHKCQKFYKETFKEVY